MVIDDLLVKIICTLGKKSNHSRRKGRLNTDEPITL